ncbi:MAG TPA: hypothetical protein VFA76_01935 [Terriglobales bacterium]|nr:hypothetical protein [Terriglobales bacterium]
MATQTVSNNDLSHPEPYEIDRLYNRVRLINFTQTLSRATVQRIFFAVLQTESDQEHTRHGYSLVFKPTKWESIRDVERQFFFTGVRLGIPVETALTVEGELLIRYMPRQALTSRLIYYGMRLWWYWNGPGLLEHCPIYSD